MDGGRKRDYFHSLNYTLPRSHVNREARMHARGLFIQLPSIQGPFLHRVRTILLARSTKSQTDFFPRYSTRRIDACDARNKGSLNEAEGRGRGVLRPRSSFSLEIGRNASVRGSFVLRRNCGVGDTHVSRYVIASLVEIVSNAIRVSINSIQF